MSELYKEITVRWGHLFLCYFWRKISIPLFFPPNVEFIMKNATNIPNDLANRHPTNVPIALSNAINNV